MWFLYGHSPFEKGQMYSPSLKDMHTITLREKRKSQWVRSQPSTLHCERALVCTGRERAIGRGAYPSFAELIAELR
jgi:hypothetical protein